MGVRTDPVTPNQTSPGVVGTNAKANIYQESSTALHDVGTRMKLSDGRTFYYCRAGSAGIVEPGRLVASILITDDEEDINLAAAEVIGSKEISVLAVAATGTTYVGGYFTVVAGTGAGQTHKIRNCSATAAAGTATVHLYDELVTALDTSSDTVLIANPFYGVEDEVTAGDGQISQVLGVAPISVTANYYFWLQTYGWASTLRGDTTGNVAPERTCYPHANGTSVLTTSGGVAGAQIIGYQINDSDEHGVAGEWELTLLTCIP